MVDDGVYNCRAVRLVQRGLLWHDERIFLKAPRVADTEVKEQCSGSSFTYVKLIRKFIFIQQLVSHLSSHGSILEVNEND